jgi:predicted ATP-grasp superfamily ATP-dependent carboligase
VPTLFQHGSLGIVRSLGRFGVPVHVNYERRGAPIRSSRFASEGAIWRRWPNSVDEAIERLIEWARGASERAVLIPVDDAAALAVAEHADELSEHFLFPRQHAALSSELSDKLQLARRCDELSIPSPRTVAFADSSEFEKLLPELIYPVVVKRIANRDQDDYDTPSVRIVETADRLRILWDDLASHGAADNHLLQEYIPGGSDTVWMFNGYFDDDSRCLVGYTGFKIRQYPPGRGPTTLGECRWNEEVARLATRLLTKLGYRGVVDLGFRFDRRDGRYKLLDVNPRIGATFRLFVTPSGTDVARALYLDLNGRSVPADRPTDGRRWLVEPLDVRSCYHDPRLLRRWLGTLVSVDERAWFAADDPLPSAVMTTALIRRAAGKLVSRNGAEPTADDV